MTLKAATLVGETSTTTGTGTYSLGGALTGVRTFVGAGLATFKVPYFATKDSDFEAGIGLVTDGAPDTLSRLTILESSNAGAAVNWGAGDKEIICQLPGRWFPYPVGTMLDWPAATVPDLHLEAYGQAISRTTYHLLFDLYGTTYGAGDGSATFNLPDLRGRFVAGEDDMGGTSANRLTGTSGGVDGDTLGGTGGSESHTLITGEMPAHDHGIRGSNVTRSGTAVNHFTMGQNTTGLSEAIGGGGAHNNLQPVIVLKKLIFAGA